MEDRADNLTVRCFNAGRGEHLGVADDDMHAVDGRRHAVARVISGILHALGVELALVGGAHRLRDRVIGERLGEGGDFEQRLLGMACLGVHRDD